jgi:DNA mismatch endonuclease, patch repair protein
LAGFYSLVLAGFLAADSNHPKSRQEFWADKFQKTVLRDKIVVNSLLQLGWDVYVIWECETKSEENLENRIKRIFAG